MNLFESNQLVEVIDDDGDNCGRKVVAKRDIKIGETILCSDALSTVLHRANWHRRCHVCFSRPSESSSSASSPAKLQRCARCKLTHYCSKSCQLLSWNTVHRYECNVLAAASHQLASCPSDASAADFVLALRILLQNVRKNDKLLSKPVSSSSSSSSSTTTTSSSSSDPLSTIYDELAELYDSLPRHRLTASERHESNEALAQWICAALGETTTTMTTSISEADVVALLERMQVNNFSIDDESLTSIGSGAYPLGALLNHSCRPNCALSYDLRTQRQWIRTIAPVARGEQLTHSYVDLAGTAETRRATLAERYGFECRCERCTQPTLAERAIDAALVAMLPQAESDEADASSSSADDASSSPSYDVLLGIARDAHDAGGLLLDDVAASCAKLEEALSIRTKLLGPLHVDLLATLRVLAYRYLELQRWPDAIDAQRRLVDAYARIYPEHHPALALDRYKLATFLVAIDRLDDALPHLHSALAAFRVSHGPHSAIFSEVTETLQEISAEVEESSSPSSSLLL
jgi:[histone H3]-lysine4/36 N-trimethyltransferase SMYD